MASLHQRSFAEVGFGSIRVLKCRAGPSESKVHRKRFSSNKKIVKIKKESQKSNTQ